MNSNEPGCLNPRKPLSERLSDGFVTGLIGLIASVVLYFVYLLTFESH